MNDEMTPGSGGPDAADAGPQTAGAMIRAARESQGLDAGSLAAMLKIPLRRLEALENGRHDELQGPTFERALAQAACRVLKIDPKPVLALLPQHASNTLERVSEGINTPFRERQGGSALGDLPSVARPALIAVAVLVVAALALLFLPETWWTRVSQAFKPAVPASAPAETASAPAAAASASVLPAEPVVAASAAPVPVPVPVASAASAAAPLTPAASASATAAQGIDEVLAHVAAAPGIPVQITATADSWCEVLDAQGRTLLSRTVLAGETVGLDGALPMKVKIGNARVTRVKLRGDNLDLTPFTRDNVARLELK
jgi:cytoskeleton protein RodZ